MFLNKPLEYGGDVNKAEISSSGFVVACGDTSKSFDAVEEALDKISETVKTPVVTPALSSIAGWRNDRLDASVMEFVDDGIGVVPTICETRSC